MKTYLVTYYFISGSVRAVRYEIDKEIFKTKNEFIDWLEKQKFVSNIEEAINMSNVCRFTIDEIEGDEENVYK